MDKREATLYEPIKNLLTAQGFTVRGEVNYCDIAAVRGGELWLVEMKLSANLTLIYQAMERKKITSTVFIAIPRPRNSRSKNFMALKKLLKKLEIGLITVALDSPVLHAEIIALPSPSTSKKENKKAAAVKKEIHGRSFDTLGGTTKTKINTAYRERCIKIACFLEQHKDGLSAKQLRNMGCEHDAWSILSNNNYGWFVKLEKGVYGLTESGREFLAEGGEIVGYYRGRVYPSPTKDM
ncbi:MAG: DUF2161 family putative PD-(D/E)XK-type phosphodiesterase [Defluviitaleaceae bacterium]|nr:DUF2161 family putative PD-(D/E)XK-type phosphodiesterase [Defluviitaleaceae bacterium]